jgi:hypothetical protein
MTKNTQLLWIAEAEARRYQERALTQHTKSESHVSVVSAMHRAARLGRWRRLIAQVSPAAAEQQTALIDTDAAKAAAPSEAREDAEPDRSNLADLVETSCDTQRG